LSSLVCLGRHTLTGILTTAGRQFIDWSADYRLFSKNRFEPDKIFTHVRKNLLNELPPNAPFVCSMDDSLFRKTGKKTPGVAYRRDPLGPPFHVNFIRAQRIFQISGAWPAGEGSVPARMIPIDFRHCPTPKKPSQKASPLEQAQYRKSQKEQRISKVGVDRLKVLREALDQDIGGISRQLIVSVDGGYTNGTVLKGMPPRTTLIGRIRKDARLYLPPEKSDKGTRGRKKIYGERLPTPEELRQDVNLKYQKIEAWAAGKTHEFKIKTLSGLKWRTAGQNHNLRLIIIAPLAYRITKGSRLLYRRPAYLICTDSELSLRKALQIYLWRWDIEVNFRDEKHLLGTGQAQVRKESSVHNVPALIIAAYAMLLIAAGKTYGMDQKTPLTVPKPKWRKYGENKRPATQGLINQLRAELWGNSIRGDNFYGFVNEIPLTQKPKKWKPDLTCALLYACK